MASKAGPRMRGIVQKIPTGYIMNNNQRIDLSIATQVETKVGTLWKRPGEVAERQATTLKNVITQNKGQLKDGTVEVSQREGMHRSENDPSDHLTCVVVNKDGTAFTDHFPVPKTDIVDEKSTDKKVEEKKTEKTKGKK